MRRRALEQRLGGLLIENARVDRAVIQFAKREKSGERNAPIASLEGAVCQKCEKKSRDFVGKRRIRLAAECCHLGSLDGVEQSELRLHHSGMGLRAAEFDTDRAVQLD